MSPDPARTRGRRESRSGIWVPARGTSAALDHPRELLGASWERTRDAVLAAERFGLDTMLVVEHTINPLGDELEAWTATAALAALTERIELIVAVKPKLFHPVVLAKMALQIEEISRGPVALNAFDAAYKPELERSGVGFGEHDERYAYGREWLHVVRELLTGKRLDHDGRFFHIHGLQLRPAGRFRERPLLYVGGESEPVRALVADLGDVWLVKASSRRHRRPARRRPPPGPRRAALRFGIPAFVIARRSAEEATAELESQWRLDGPDARTAMLANTDPQARMFASAITTAPDSPCPSAATASPVSGSIAHPTLCTSTAGLRPPGCTGARRPDRGVHRRPRPRAAP